MIAPTKHKEEEARISELNSYSILDSLPEEDYDYLTTIAAEICGTEISLISLVDNKRQWFKSRHGLSAKETPKEISFCAHAINDAENLFIVKDARIDERFHDNPLVTGDPKIVFYAGIPLLSDNGLPLGTLCVIDRKSKSLSENQIKSLNALAKQIMNILNLRKTKIRLEKALQNMETKNRALEQFSYLAAHDLKSPLRSISGISKLFKKKYGSEVDSKGNEWLDIIESSATQLSSLIDGLLDYSKTENILKETKSIIQGKKLKKDLLSLFSHEEDLAMTFNFAISEIETNETALKQILINLIANAIKYNDKGEIKIEIGIAESATHYEFCVKDNGPGIPEASQQKIFELFGVTGNKDRYGKSGTGIGLATVKKLVLEFGGAIQLESKIHEGSNFTFTIKK